MLVKNLKLQQHLQQHIGR